MCIFGNRNVQKSDDRMRVIYTLFLLLFLIGTIDAQPIDSGILSHRLQEALDSEPDAFHHLSILLTDRVDVKTMDQKFYANKTAINNRAVQVINTLKEKANETQKPILDLLRTSPNVDPTSIRPFWITNVIFVKAKKEMIAYLSQRPNVEWMDLNGTLLIDEYKDETILAPPLEGAPESGLIAIKAPELWKMGYTGYCLLYTSDAADE